MKNLQRALIGAGILGAVALGNGTAYAWGNGTADDTVVLQEITGKTEATITAEGLIKKWDPQNPGDGPVPTDKTAWIDVEIPAKILFGQTDATEGKIVAPIYKIKNNSAQGVKVSLQDFKTNEKTESLTNLSLNFENQTANKTIPLINGDQKGTFPAEVGTMKNQAEEITFSLSGSVGDEFHFDKEIHPKYDLVLKFEVVEK